MRCLESLIDAALDARGREPSDKPKDFAKCQEPRAAPGGDLHAPL